MIAWSRLLAALPALLLLAGCADPLDMARHDHYQRHPIGVESRVAVAVLGPAGEHGFDRDDAAALAELARQHAKRGAGAIELRAQAPGDAERAAAELARLGLAEGQVAVVGAADVPAGKVEVRVPVWVAVVPVCGEFERPLNPDYDNAPNSNFGCATQRNIGLMVSNPADLVRARESTGRYGGRASDVLDKYAKGAATGSVREGASTLSTVGGSSGGASSSGGGQ